VAAFPRLAEADDADAEFHEGEVGGRRSG
jgi:hypothetical protein